MLAIQQINEDGFLVGEGGGSGGGFPSVDVAYNLEIGLGALVVYSCLSGSDEVRDAVLKALETHLNFITPSGYIDDSWGTRMWQWTLLGNKAGSGCQTALLPLRNFDARFQRAAGQNLRYMIAGSFLFLAGILPLAIRQSQVLAMDLIGALPHIIVVCEGILGDWSYD